MTDSRLFWMLMGVVALLAAKYVIIGTDNWNTFFFSVHQTDDAYFRKPVIGLWH